MLLGAHDEAEQRVLLLLSINHHLASEKPVATVLTVGDIRREIYFYKFQIYTSVFKNKSLNVVYCTCDFHKKVFITHKFPYMEKRRENLLMKMY